MREITAVICALPEENRTLIPERLSPGQVIKLDGDRLLGVSGMGSRAAEAMAREMIKKGATRLMSWGFAGSLTECADESDLLLPASVVCSESTFQVDAVWQREILESFSSGGLDVCTHPIYCSETILFNPDDKKRKAKDMSCCSVDMESAAVASIAHEKALPFLVLKSVTDKSFQSLPDYIVENQNLGNIMWSLFLNPTSLPSLVGLMMGYRRAVRQLSMASRHLQLSVKGAS